MTQGRNKFGYRRHCWLERRRCLMQAWQLWFDHFAALYDWPELPSEPERPGSIELMAETFELAVERYEVALFYDNELADSRPAAFEGGLQPGQVIRHAPKRRGR